MSKELDSLQRAKEINFVLRIKPSLPTLEYLERSHEKNFNAMYHHNFGPELVRPKTRSKKPTTYIYQTNSWNEQAQGEKILARVIVLYCLFVFLRECVVNQFHPT
jgi:hypothetical protein